MALRLIIEKTDGNRSTVPVLAKTQVDFEKQYQIGFGKIGDAGKTEYIFWLAWHAEHASGAVVKPFPDWLSDIAEVSIEQGPGEIRKQIADLEAQLQEALRSPLDSGALPAS